MSRTRPEQARRNDTSRLFVPGGHRRDAARAAAALQPNHALAQLRTLADQSPTVQRLRAVQAGADRRAAMRQGAARAAPVGGVVQRRIGFELETGIPLARRVPGVGGAADTYRGLDNDQLNAPYPGGTLMVDHLPGHPATALEHYGEWNIVEFVTDPVDDRMSSANFRNIATGWVHNLQALEAYAQANHGPVQNAPNVGAPGSGLDVRIGIPPGGNAAAPWGRLGPQATMGIKLSAVGRIFRDETHASGFHGHVRHDRVAQGAQPADARADLIMADIQDLYPKFAPTLRQGYREMQGLMVLICNYLLSGAANAGRGGYAKNHTSMMYKSMLSSVRNAIIGKSYPASMLANPVRRAQIVQIVLNRCERGPHDEVFEWLRFGLAPIFAGPWVNAVLSGGTDLVFLAMKNPWSNEIAPEAIHGDAGAVMEMRDTSDFGIGAHGIAGLHDTANIVDYLASLYGLNKRWSKR